jgi:hypothetical protein
VARLNAKTAQAYTNFDLVKHLLENINGLSHRAGLAAGKMFALL